MKKRIALSLALAVPVGATIVYLGYTDPLKFEPLINQIDRLRGSEEQTGRVAGVSTSINITSEIADLVRNDDGSFLIKYKYTITNTGSETVYNIKSTSDLAKSFSPHDFRLVSLTSNKLTVNPNYNGASDKNLLTGKVSLGANSNATINLTVKLFPGGDEGPFENHVDVYGDNDGPEAPSESNTGNNNNNNNGSGTSNGNNTNNPGNSGNNNNNKPKEPKPTKPKEDKPKEQKPSRPKPSPTGDGNTKPSNNNGGSKPNNNGTNNGNNNNTSGQNNGGTNQGNKDKKNKKEKKVTQDAAVVSFTLQFPTDTGNTGGEDDNTGPDYNTGTPDNGNVGGVNDNNDNVSGQPTDNQTNNSNNPGQATGNPTSPGRVAGDNDSDPSNNYRYTVKGGQSSRNGRVLAAAGLDLRYAYALGMFSLLGVFATTQLERLSHYVSKAGKSTKN